MSTLYVVATPLGNLEDLTARARRILTEVDELYAEDTRRTSTLLQHLGIVRRLASLHEHNEHKRIDGVLAHLEAGRSVALVSDAGTPVVSDPGHELVAAVKAAGYVVTPVVGPSALAAALSVAGFPATDALFAGFVPHKGKARSETLERIAGHTGAVVIYESPHRAAKTLTALASVQPERPACALRELTKLHEEIRDGTLSNLLEWARAGLRGELTIVLGPWRVDEVCADDAEVDAALLRCLNTGLSTRDAATAVAAVLERPRREVYQRAQSAAAEPDESKGPRK